VGGIVAIAIIAAVAGLALVVSRGGLDGARYTVSIRAEGLEGVQVKGSVPGYGVGEVAEFVAGLELPTGSRIRGIPEGDRVVLRFSDEVPERMQQRVRNFFYLKR